MVAQPQPSIVDLGCVFFNTLKFRAVSTGLRATESLFRSLRESHLVFLPFDQCQTPLRFKRLKKGLTHVISATATKR